MIESRQNPRRRQAWWTTVVEDSLPAAEGEVLSLLWSPGGALAEMVDCWPSEILSPEPGRKALEQVARGMGEELAYYPVSWTEEELVMETRAPSRQRLVLSEAKWPGVEGVRALVAEIARQKGVEEDEVVMAVGGFRSG